MIPTLPPSPPSSPERQLDVAPDWFRVTEKPTSDTLHGMITSLNSPNMTVPELSPPMSPETSSSDDGAHRPRRPRYSFQTHRRASEMAPEPAWTSAAPKHKHRARFSSLPVAGMITPMWSIGEESDADDEEIRTPTSDRFQPDPFKMLLPFCKNDVKLPSYTLNEKDFVLAHVPTKRISAAAFRPRVPRVPRYQRPIVMTVLCVMLFGTLCMVSWFQQAAIDAQRATVIRQTVWLAKASAQIQGEEEARVDREPGFRPAAPAHHSLKVQSKLSPRLPQVELPPLEMSKAEELAALMHFVTGTAANALPITHDPTKQIEAEAFLPFNPASPDAMTELEELVREQWEQYPVMVLGKMRDPKMREIRRVLKTYNIKPAPAFVDFDQRSDSTLLDAVLARLLGKQNGPYVLMQGENLKASAVTSLQKDEKVVELLSQAGATAAKRLKRNKHQKEEERWENERVLGPRTPDEAVVEPEDIVEEVVQLD